MAPFTKCAQAGAAVLMLLVLSILTTPVTAGHEEKWERLPYELALPLHKPVVDNLGVASNTLDPECDDRGFVAVRFCESLNDGTGWNRATIRVWDHGNPTPVPVGAKYAFRTSDGFVVGEGAFCEQARVRVPSGANELFVEVAHVDSFEAEGPSLKKCAAVPFEGDVQLKWSKVSEPELGDPPEEQEPPKCVCECDCHPVFGCECECRPVDGSDCECDEEE